jgi:MSHA type pilus biogenesis protein MshL
MTHADSRIRLPRIIALALATAALAACATPTQRLASQLAPNEPELLARGGEVLAEDAARIAEHQQRIREALERSVQQAATAVPPPPAYDPLEDKVVSINMYDTEVGHLLWALAEQLGMNLIVDPAVLQQKQRASLFLKDVTAREVYDHILQSFDLHGEARGDTLIVSLMQERVFDLAILNTAVGIDVSAGGNVFGGMGSGGSGGGGGGGAGGGGGDGTLRGNFTLSGSNQALDPFEQIEKAVSNILGPQAEADQRRDELGIPRTTHDLNRVSGSLFVRARPSQVRAIGGLLDRVQAVMSRQVLVEAQLIDLKLSDGFEFGVDWNLLRRRVAGVLGDSPLLASPGEGIVPYGPAQRLPERTLTIPGQVIGGTDGRAAGLMYGRDGFSVALSALRSFGQAKVLSNPSVRVRNGTPAMLSIGTNIRYVSKSSFAIQTPGGGASSTQSDVQTDSLFSGIIIGVMPFIHEDGRVEMLIHPMQTEVDPTSLALVDVGGGNRVTLPVISYKGITTTLNLRDGDTIVIGGLIDETRANSGRGLPGLADVPTLGRVFDDSRRSLANRELVMVLRAKVL